MRSLQPFDPLPTREIAAALEGLSHATVAVLGDFCMDVYWPIDRSASEASVETGLPTEPVCNQRYSPGGAGNVVTNLLALGVGRIFPIGVLGDDPFGREMSRQLVRPGIDSRGLIVQSENWATHAYVKPYEEGAELSRIDHGNFNRLAAETEEKLFACLAEVIPQVSVVLINHQVIGSIHDSPSFRERLCRVIREHREVSFIVDSRGYHEAYAPAVHKLNDREVMVACGHPVGAGEIVPLDALEKAVGELQTRWGSSLVVTRGDCGCLVCDGSSLLQIFGILVMGKTDPVGAGDTFVSALAGIVSTGTNLNAAAFVANMAAAVTAQKLFQTGTASPEEILGVATDTDFVFRPELAQSPHRAQFFNSSEIEIIAEPPKALDIRHAIFDHDGTISTLREGWEQIMEPMMMRAILGKHYATADEALFHRAKTRVLHFIETTTGIQTIVQMQGLVELVREFNLVPEAEILDAPGYKAIYNIELKKLVDARLAKLDRGELEISDFTVKGAVPFLESLHRSGVRLYLASGTDDEDVKFEAQRLGYASLFTGGIFGSVGNMNKDAKKVVLERILDEVNGKFGELLALGDGPVEIRETIRRGGYAIGIASDEVRRFGHNREKRARLIRAGAQAVIPDFSQHETLWQFLNLPKS
jgi:bifunctional ADP-heptose synthase (sugar kinase/adenylyltransferase)/phosphoglycolate phosphatase-like HAD superfamily hydrolase